MSFHLDQAHGDGFTADNKKRVYVIARHLASTTSAVTALGHVPPELAPPAQCRYAFVTLNQLIDALLLSPVVLIARSVLLPALVAWLLRAPLAEAEQTFSAATCERHRALERRRAVLLDN